MTPSPTEPRGDDPLAGLGVDLDAEAREIRDGLVRDGVKPTARGVYRRMRRARTLTPEQERERQEAEALGRRRAKERARRRRKAEKDSRRKNRGR